MEILQNIAGFAAVVIVLFMFITTWLGVMGIYARVKEMHEIATKEVQ